MLSLLKQWLLSPLYHKTLFIGFIRQDIQGRFAGSIGGLFWSILTPLANIFIYIFVFSFIMKVRVAITDTGTDSFVIYLLSGLLPWLAFSEALSRANSLLLDKSGLITKVSFPVEVLPAVGTSVSFLLNGIAYGLFLAYLVLQGYASIFWCYLPLVVLLHFFFTLGLVAFLSALSVFIRDTQQVMGLVLHSWLYLTPIIYPLGLIPITYQKYFYINPLYAFIELYREVLLAQHITPEILFLACFFTLLSCFGGWFFMRTRHAFSDVL